MPKGAPQERIYPTQIESFSLSSKETIKVNQDLDKWQRLYPEQSRGFLFFKKKEGIPRWVVDATSKKVTDAIALMNALNGAKQQCMSFLQDLNDDEPETSDSGDVGNNADSNIPQSKQKQAAMGLI